MPQIFNSLWKSKLAIPLVVAVIASTTFLAVSHYKIGQTASVVAGSCYLQTEIDKMVGDKTSFESQVSELNNQLTQINTDLITNSENIAATQSKIETLNGELVSDYALTQKQTEVNNLYAELGERKALDDMSSEYQAKTKEISDKNTELKSVNKDRNDLFISQPLLSAQTKAKISLEDSGKMVASTKSALDDITLQIADKKILEAKEVEMNTAKTASDTAAKNANTKNTPDLRAIATTLFNNYNTVAASYNKLLSSYKSTYPKFTTPTLQTSANMTITRTSLNTDYNTKNTNFNNSAASYKKAYPQNYNLTSLDLSNLYNANAKKYSELVSRQNGLNIEIDTLTNRSTILKAKFALAVKSYQLKYKYKSAIPTVSDLQATYDKASSAYSDLVTKNTGIKAEIEKLNNDTEGFNTAITDLNSRLTNVQTDITAKTAQIADLTTAISNAQNNICPSAETSCTDGIDNDRNGVQDCEDSSCANDSACQPQNVNTVDTTQSTTFNGTEICNDGIDNDTDGMIDCGDSDCLNDAYCTASGNTNTVSVEENNGANKNNAAGSVCGNGKVEDGEECDGSFPESGRGSCVPQGQSGECMVKCFDGYIKQSRGFLGRLFNSVDVTCVEDKTVTEKTCDDTSNAPGWRIRGFGFKLKGDNNNCGDSYNSCLNGYEVDSDYKDTSSAADLDYAGTTHSWRCILRAGSVEGEECKNPDKIINSQNCGGIKIERSTDQQNALSGH